jgi:hypothetical protein
LFRLHGIDAMTINHHGSESSSNSYYIGAAAPAVALVGVGDGQGAFSLPKKTVIDGVLLGQPFTLAGQTINVDITQCSGLDPITPPLVLQNDDDVSEVTGDAVSSSGFTVGNITITTDGWSSFAVDADGETWNSICSEYTRAPYKDERMLAGLPQKFQLDDYDMGNWAIEVYRDGKRLAQYILPPFTRIPRDGGRLIIGRDASPSDFQSVWPKAQGIPYVDAQGGWPALTGGETINIRDLDGYSYAGTNGKQFVPGAGIRRGQCQNFTYPWTVVPVSQIDPSVGGDGVCSSHILYLSQISDAASGGDKYQFIEFYFQYK